MSKDSLVDKYSTRLGYEKLPENMPMASRNTHLNTWYPWNTLAVPVVNTGC